MFPDACTSVYYEERAAEWEAAKRKAADEAAKAKEQADRLNQVSNRLAQLQRPGMPSRAASTGYFGALFQSFNNQQKPQSQLQSQSTTPKSATRSASASPPPTGERKLKPSELPMPKATWAGPSEGEVCVVPAWS